MDCVAQGTLGPNNTCTCCPRCRKSPCDCCPACEKLDCVCVCTTCGLLLKDKCTCCKQCYQALGACTCCDRCERVITVCDCCGDCESLIEDCKCPCKRCQKNPCECCSKCETNRDYCSCVCDKCEKKPCECCTVCQEAPTQCKCICEVCQKLKRKCECCRSCRKFPCSKCSRCKTRPCGCCPRCERLECSCCKKCKAVQCVCQETQEDVTVTEDSTNKTNTAENTPKPTFSMAQGFLEPPDMSILKDSNQLEFYLSALESWEEIQDCNGYPAQKRAAVIFNCAFKTHPALCKEMGEHFKKTLKDKADGVEQISSWLRTKFGLNKHADIVRVLNKWLNTTRSRNESLLDYITRFEAAHNEVESLGETLSPTFKAVLLLRQADLTDTDHHIITVNIDLNPKAEGAKKHFEDVKGAMRKFQHTRQANAAIKGPSHQPTKTYLTQFLEELEADESLEDDTKYNIHTYLAQSQAQARGGRKNWSRNRGGGGRGGGYQGGGGGGHGGQHQDKEKFWKCVYCICKHRRWERCGCPCTKHTKEQCPNPDPAKVQAERDRKNDNKRKDDTAKKPEEKRSKPAEPERGYYSYMSRLDAIYGEDNTDTTFLTKMVRVEDRSEPLPLNYLLEQLGVIPAPPPPSVSPALSTFPPVEQNYDEAPRVSLVLHRSAGANTQVRPSKDSSILTDRNLFHATNETFIATETNITVENDQQEKIFIGDGSKQQERPDLDMLLDTGSPSSLAGLDEFKKIKDQYPAMIQATFRYEESTKQFEFGGGETTPSLGKVQLPMYVVDIEGEIRELSVSVEILKQRNLPFLLGGRSMRKAQSVIDLAKLTLTVTSQGETMELPLKQHHTGHLLLRFFPSSVRDERDKTGSYLSNEKWTPGLSNAAINYLLSEDATVADIFTRTEHQLEQVLITKHRKGDQRPLSRKEINKLHHVFGHAHPDKLQSLVMKSGKYDDTTLAAIKDLKDCEVCKVENSRIPRPRVALPRSSAFGHVLCMDLKENRRYKNAPPYILYMIDTYSRFKVACFIPDKKTETVAEALVTEWIKFFGPPRYIMADRGNEFMGGAMRDLCTFHDIRFTSTASYSPHQNAKAERGHAVVDRALERMITAQPSIKPKVALAWVIQASNILQNVDGFCPFMLVFGRVPQHPTLVDVNPGNNEEIIDTQARWAEQYRAMMSAREAFTAAESDKVLRKGLEQRIYSDHSVIKVGDWIYFKRNIDRHWQGPAKLVMKNGKNLHLSRHGQPVSVNADDVLLHKPNMEEATAEDFITLPQPQQPPPASTSSHPGGQSYDDSPRVSQVLSGPSGPNLQVSNPLPDQTSINSVSLHDKNETESEAASQDQDQPQPSLSSQQSDQQEQDGNNDVTQHLNSQSPANSTNIPARVRDLGEPVMCNLCQKEFSSLTVRQHIQDQHQIIQPNMRSLTTLLDKKPDSLYENVNNLKAGVAMVDQQGDYFVLLSPTADGWRVRSLVTQQEKELELIRDMTEMRYIGLLDSQTPEGVNVIKDQSKQFINFADYRTRIFFTAQEHYNPEVAYMVNIPRSRHAEPKCVAAKNKELSDFSSYDVYEVVDRPPRGTKVINTQWVLVEKDKPDGTTVTKARLCIEGNFEENRHLIPVDSPTVNPISIKVITTIGASLGHSFQTADVQRAFLQSDAITRDVFVKPPAEMNLPRDKVWKLKRTAYGLVDASRAYFLKQAKELVNINFKPSRLDPALFIHKKEGEEVFDIATAVHVDDALSVGEKDSIDNTQKVMATKFTYGAVDQLPFRFLGQNYKRDDYGNLTVDTEHYMESMVLPDAQEYQHLVKQDVLPEKLQSVFRSLASKLNTISRVSRPDYSYQAKFLTTRYGKATKSDLTAAIKLLKLARQESTETVIPDIGRPEDWLLVGVADASHKTGAEMMTVGAHVVLLMNKVTEAASVLHWSSKKIDRICNSSCAAETIALQRMFSSLYFVRELLKELCGSRVAGLECITITDNHALFSNVHHLKSNTDDYRLQTEVLSIRQSIEDDKIAQELRCCLSDENIADGLTKAEGKSKTILSSSMLCLMERTSV